MDKKFLRTQMLFGNDAMEKLKNSSVAVFGVGGVGSYAAIALARSGVGNISVFDMDTVSESNINRQLIANVNTIGRYKTDVMKEMILSVNPDAAVNTFCVYYTPSNAENFDLTKYDYVIDAIDIVTSKIHLIKTCKEQGINIISSMGTGNKICPDKLKVCDIYKTSGCPLARVLRRELKKRNINSLKVVYSEETALKPYDDICDEKKSQRTPPGSTSFVPPVAGFIIAGEVIKELGGII